VHRTLLGTLFLAASFLAHTESGAQAPPVQFEGNLRFGVVGIDRHERDGSDTTYAELRGRARVGASVRLSENVLVRARIAARFQDRQPPMRIWTGRHSPTAAGLAPGDIGVDELNVAFPLWAGARLRLGRMQTSFQMPDVTRKSFFRNDSPSFDVTWTDGGHLVWTLPGEMTAHLVLQHNSERGPSNAFRSPLRFDDSASRVTVFSALESRRAAGPVFLRGAYLTVVPQALPGADERRNYVAINGRVATQFPLDGPRLVLGAEAGYAPFRPYRAGTTEQLGGTALLMSASVMGIARRHDVGVIASRTEAGWLLSPNFRNNNLETELRYGFRATPRTLLEVRGRRRADIETPAGLDQRVEYDTYVRVTTRF
jgi:hypothetical protein